jgi:hypothetical protein
LLLIVGNGPYSTAEIQRFVGIPDIIEIADDPSAAAVLTAGRGTERRLARSGLVKSARRLAHTLADPGPETQALRNPDVTPLDHAASLDNKPAAEISETLKKESEADTSDRPLSLQDQR